MVDYCEEILREIRSAPSDIELESVVMLAIQRVEERRTYLSKEIFYITMIGAIHQELRAGIRDRVAMRNLNYSLGIFQRLRNECKESPF